MFGAVQLGLLAACTVLFVPMGMAGWHLSRNKVLFFSGALFITLAVGVHLTPYFPTISTFMSSLSSPILVSQNPHSCISLLHQIDYKLNFNTTSADILSHNNDNGHDKNVSGNYDVYWGWEKSGSVLKCEFEKLGKLDASDLLNGSWVVLVGDSQARLIMVSLLNLVLGEEEFGKIRGDLFKRHSDYRIVVDEIGVKLEFVWAPYVSNLTDLMMEFRKNKNYPDVLVMGAGLWEMLHVTNVSDYGLNLRLLRDAVASLVPISPDFGTDGLGTGLVTVRSPHLFWLGMPMLVNSILNTEEKREKMTNAMLNAYDEELYGSKLLRQYGGPLLLLDIQSLSRKCGTRCAIDGVHYDEAVYEAVVHVMLNALLIESHQKL